MASPSAMPPVISVLPFGSKQWSQAVPAVVGRSMLASLVTPAGSPPQAVKGGARVGETLLMRAPFDEGRFILAQPADAVPALPEKHPACLGPIPFENALSCPVAESPFGHSDWNVRLAVAVLLLSGHGDARSVLLTRRTPKMRTFPGAWVVPGGGVDAGEDPAEAAARELLEEVGVQVSPDSLEPLCLWESVYPTTREACQEVGKIGGHHLLLFFKAQVEDAILEKPVSLQASEADAALWLQIRHLWAFHLLEEEEQSTDAGPEVKHSTRRNADGRWPPQNPSIPISFAEVKMVGDDDPPGQRTATQGIDLVDLAQLYPSSDGLLNGCGEAHMFALRELARTEFDAENTSDPRNSVPSSL